jgi:mycofactocin precursor peptide peptidase
MNIVAESFWLADLAWPDVEQRVSAGAFLAVPVGSTEQHGPHLPLSTDTDVAVALCERLAQRRSDVLVAPVVAYGSSGEHAGFAGTLSIGHEALTLLLIELGRSITLTFPRLFFVSAHGGNHDAVTRAGEQLRRESREVLVYEPRWRGDAHAGRVETSMVLALTPDRVQMTRAVRGDTRQLAEILPTMRAGGVRAVSESGILGDPIGADATDGERLLDELSAALASQVTAWLESSAR